MRDKLRWIDTRIKNTLEAWRIREWICRHDWCYRESTYQYRCPEHMDDP